MWPSGAKTQMGNKEEEAEEENYPIIGPGAYAKGQKKGKGRGNTAHAEQKYKIIPVDT